MADDGILISWAFTIKATKGGSRGWEGGPKQKHFLYLLFTCVQQLHLVCQALNCRLQILVFILQPLNLIFFLSAKQRYSAMSSHAHIQAHMQAKHIHMRVHKHTAVQVHMCTQIQIYTHCNAHTPSVNSSWNKLHFHMSYEWKNTCCSVQVFQAHFWTWFSGWPVLKCIVFPKKHHTSGNWTRRQEGWWEEGKILPS